MPRSRTFSSEEVLELAADLFTTHGFGGTSLAMLTDATGLGKQSLYNAFGDKRAMYLQAVDCAVARFAAVAIAMRNAPDGCRAVELFFERLLDLCVSPSPAEHSCIVSAGLLEGIEEPGVQAVLQAKWQGTHELLRAAVERGQRDRSITSQAPSVEVADLLMSVMSGLRVMARTGASRERLAAASRLALAALGSLRADGS